MGRDSRYRTLMRDVLDAAKGPLSATDLHRLLGDSGIGLATIYRLIKKGQEAGDLVCVELPGGPRRFELSDKRPHHHFECVVCHTVFDVEGGGDEFDNLTPEGFELEQHQVLLSGRCPECAGHGIGSK